VDLAGVADEALGLLAVNRALPFRDAVERMHEPGLLVMIQPAILKRQVPTKLYDYLCSGNPVLVMATEDSAAWRVARRFPRAFRADPDDARGIQEVLAELEARHRAGELRQEATDVDTVALSKQSIGDEFIQAAFGIAHPTPSP
jgi:hypothetical protein